MAEPRDSRPRPQYGEYADPDEVSGAPAAQPGDAHGGAAPAAPTAPVAAPGTVPVPSVGRLPGVPHNLGVSDAAQHSSAQASPGPSEPYRAAPPVQPTHAAAPQTPPQTRQTPVQQQGSAPHAAVDAAPGKRSVDRIVTVLLLGVGAYGALNLGFSLLQLRAQVALAAEMLKLDGFVVPQQVGTIGTIGAIAVLALYALTLIFSIRRIRVRKLTFWAPLAAGAIAVLIFVAVATIAYVQSPELVQAMAQPDAIQAIFDYAESQ